MFTTLLKYVIADIALHVFFDQLERNLATPLRQHSMVGELVLIHLHDGEAICGSIIYDSVSSVVVCYFELDKGCWINQSISRDKIQAIEVLDEWEMDEYLDDEEWCDDHYELATMMRNSNG